MGADLDKIAFIWIAAPLTGLVVQPIVGYLSDRTWNRVGRRKPYFLVGAALAASALWLMPRAPTLWFAAAFLWMLDASINVSMEPFRAFVGDLLAPAQRRRGYAMQSFFIGVGAVVASALPWTLMQFGFSNSGSSDGPGMIPPSVRYSFDIGALVLLCTILWTVLRTREYPPKILESFNDAVAGEVPAAPASDARIVRRGVLWSGAGLIAVVLVWGFKLDRAAVRDLCGRPAMGSRFMGSWHALKPRRIRHGDARSRRHACRLALVQFFSWLALFAMWIYTTAAVAQVHFGSVDAHSDAFNAGANWVGVLFATYSGCSAVAASFIPMLVNRIGLKRTHLVNLWLGGIGLLSFLVIRDPR